ncbi:DUF6247 family protein [Streptomyces virginiae]|uniref:DUF6247 family protein n=1 Tax=Streptomyces virginiae TaxID=1961 RepID=UPI003713EDE8
MSAQPDRTPVPAAPYAPAPGAPAELLGRLRADRRAGTWVLAFERDWVAALEDARHPLSLTPLHEVARTWQLRVAADPASTPSWIPDGTSPTSWTWTTSWAAARDRTTAVGGAAVPAGREDDRRASRARPGDGPRCPGHRGAFPVGLVAVERRRSGG